ncbi:MAG: V-type ATPase subunit subunit G family protein [Coriobacteriia bacterium]
MDEKVLEEIRFHSEAVHRDANSPLFQIREKEMEISGRVFAARNQADKMISDARQRSLEIVRNAQADAERLAKEHADKVYAEIEKSIEDVKEQGVAETAALEHGLAKRQGEAADFVTKLVTTA